MISPAAVADARVLLVEAPTGYGKTTLVEQVVASRVATVVRVRPRPGEPAGAVVARALRRAGLVAAADAVVAGDAGQPLGAALGALAAVGHPVQLVLDDLQLHDPRVTDELAELVLDLPAGCVAVAAGRALGAFAALRRTPGTVAVGVEDLRLGVDDIAALLGADAGTTAAELLDATDGWPAAVALAADRLRREPRWSVSGAGGVRALLRGLVDDAVAADGRLRTVAALPLLDDHLLGLVGGSAAEPLALPTNLRGRWRVVPDVLRTQLDAAPVPPALAVDVAEHYYRNGETVAALDLLRDEAPDRVASFAARLHWDELVDLDPHDLRRLADDAGVPDTEDRARLLLAVVRAAEYGDRAQRAEWLARVDGQIGAGLTASTSRAFAAEHARDVLRSGQVERGAALAQEVLDASALDEPTTRARALVTLGMREAYECTPDTLSTARRILTEAADLYREAGETRLRAETLARLGYTALYLAGFPADAAEAMSQALGLLPVGDRLRAFWLTNYADVLNVLGRVEESDAAVREALDIGARRQDPTTSGMAWWTCSWNAASRGDRDGVRHALAQVERHRGGWLQGGQEAEYLGSSAENLLFVGDLDGYRDYLARAEQAAAEADYPEVVTSPRAYYESMVGDPTEGLRLLDELDLLPGVGPVSEPRRGLFRAVALHRLGDPDSRRAAQRATEQARVIGVPDLLERLHPDLLALVGGAGDVERPAGAENAPRQHLQLLGRFVLVADRSAQATDRTPPPGQAAALVKLLALRGATTTEAVADAMWPEADEATGRSRLRNLLNRLKDQSGPVVTRDQGMLRLADDVRVDARAFDEAATAALSAPESERVGRARHALALYTGELLPGDVFEQWAEPDRLRLARAHAALTELVALECERRGDLHEAALLLDRAVTLDPLDEALTLRLCDVLAAQGRAAAAAAVAQQHLDAMADLGVEPSAEVVDHARGR